MKEYMNSSEFEEDDGSRVPVRSYLAMQSLQFGGREGDGGRGGGGEGRERGRRASIGNGTTQYHSLADGMSGRSQFPRKRAATVDVPVLPMNILKSPVPSPPIKC